MSFPWSKEDEEKLAELIKDKSLTIDAIGQVLGKTRKSVSGKMVRMGVAKGYHCWPQWEVDALITNWPHKTPKEISAIIGRSVPAIQRKSFFLGLPRKGRTLRTFPCQICSVILESVAPNRKYCTACYDELQNKLKNRSYKKKPRLDLWPQERTDRLKELREKNTPLKVIAFILGIPKNSVSGKLNRLGLCHKQTRYSRLANSSLGGLVTKRKRASVRQIKIAKPPKQYTSKPKARLIVNGNAPSLVPLEHEPIHLVQIKNGQCKFIEGDDRMCCGRETLNGFSWCPHHYVRAHVLDRRSAPMAGVYQQPMAHSAGQEHNQSKLQEMDRRSANSLGRAEGEASTR